jgi:hypothetical protein
LAVTNPQAADAFRSDLRLATNACRAAVGTQRTNSHDNTWGLWLSFCTEHQVDPLLATIPDPIPYLQVFAQRYRDGRLAKNGFPVRSRSVEDALRAIGQTMASMGATDRRLIAPKHLDYRLSQQLAGWRRIDPPPERVTPASLRLLDYAHELAVLQPTPLQHAVVDMSYIAFFYLNRPGEYAQTTSSDPLSEPFRLCDVEFSIGVRIFNASVAPLADIRMAVFANLIFTTQKNAVRGEKIGHGRTGHSFSCPVLALIRRVLHLRLHSAPPTAPLYLSFRSTSAKPTFVTAARITAMLRLSATALYPTLGIDPKRISARSLRAGGAMALLCARVDTDIIRLVGRWRSDEMLRYLHLQAYPLMRTFAQRMLSSGHFSLLPNQDIAPEALPLLELVPIP